MVDKKEEIFDDTLNVTQGQKSFRFLSLSSGASFLFHKTKTQKLRSRDIKPDAEERERERERQAERETEKREPTNETTAKNIGVVGMVVLVVSFSGVVFAREREEETKTTTTTTRMGDVII